MNASDTIAGDTDDRPDPFEVAGQFIAEMFGPDIAAQINPDQLPGELRELLLEGQLRADDPRLIAALQSDSVRSLLRPPKPIRNTGERIGRNEPCPCGSGKKFKRCGCGCKNT